MHLRVATCLLFISLATTDAGNGNREDLANWVNAGFVLRQTGD